MPLARLERRAIWCDLCGTKRSGSSTCYSASLSFERELVGRAVAPLHAAQELVDQREYHGGRDGQLNMPPNAAAGRCARIIRHDVVLPGRRRDFLIGCPGAWESLTIRR